MQIRTRSLVPAALLAMVLIYELVWKANLVAPGSLAERAVDLLLFLLVGPLMGWWGLGTAKGLLQRLVRSEAVSEEKSRLLEQRNRQLQTVLNASRAMAAVLDLSEVAALVVQQVVTLTRFTKAVLIRGESEEQADLVLAGSHGLPAGHLERFLAALKGPQKGSSPVEWCRLTRQPVVVENLARDFRTAGLQEVFAQAGIEAMVAVPLLWQNRFRGALIVYQDQTGPISTAEISLVTALAAQAALALENARLYTVTAENRTRLDKALELLESGAAGLARTRVGVTPMLQHVAQASAKLLEPACVRLSVTRSGRRSPQVVVGYAGMETSDGLHLPPIHTLPITLDGENFGTLEVCRENAAHPLDSEELRILQAFVHLTGSALGNAALAADMRGAVDEVERAYMGTLEALIKALEIRDHETEGHSRRVVQYTFSLAQQLGVPEEELVPIMRGALLHDIGKIGIPDAILRKPGPLDESEWEIMRRHTLFGYEMLKGIEFLGQATPIILHHHERYDGNGYPKGLAGEEIPLGARIFAVADAYDAITSNRPYRKGRSHEFALDEIRKGAGTQFDAQVVEALMGLPEEELARIRGRELEMARP